MIRLTIPSIEKEDLETVCEVLESGYLTQGSYVHDFEDAIADYVKTKHVVAVSSCTAALHLSLLSLGLKTGDLAVVTTYSWIATANVIELCGAQPVFVDICPDTFNMDPNHLETVLKNSRKTNKRSKQLKAMIRKLTKLQKSSDLSVKHRITFQRPQSRIKEYLLPSTK